MHWKKWTGSDFAVMRVESTLRNYKTKGKLFTPWIVEVSHYSENPMLRFKDGSKSLLNPII